MALPGFIKEYSLKRNFNTYSTVRSVSNNNNNGSISPQQGPDFWPCVQQCCNEMYPNNHSNPFGIFTAEDEAGYMDCLAPLFPNEDSNECREECSG